MMKKDLYSHWRELHRSPFHFPVEEDIWEKSMHQDVDSDGRVLFSDLHTECTDHGMIQYGQSAFGFDENGEISQDISYNVIRDFSFEEGHEDEGRQLLHTAMADFAAKERIYAFFHYFGMSCCGRHGKLHSKESHIARLLLDNGFQVEHENVYYSRKLTESDSPDPRIGLCWKKLSSGGCREFAATAEGRELCWGQVHFLPQGDMAYLRWIYLDSSRQHQGFGTAVMNTLFAGLYEMGIRQFDTDTALDNTIAQGYYEKCGFTNEGITRSYYTK